MTEQQLRQKIAEIEAESQALYAMYEQQRREYEATRARKAEAARSANLTMQRRKRGLTNLIIPMKIQG